MLKTKLLLVLLLIISIFSLAAAKETDNRIILTADCVEQAAKNFEVPLCFLWAILDVEAGRTGEISKNKNGSYDIGPAQLNSIWLPEFSKMGISEEMLLNNPCINVYGAAYILSKELKENPNYFGLGSYHSKTEKHQSKYLKRIAQSLQALNVNQVLKRINNER